MITASTSSRLTAEAMPAPSALHRAVDQLVSRACRRARSRAPRSRSSGGRGVLARDLEQHRLRARRRAACARGSPSPPARRRPRRSRVARMCNAVRPDDHRVADLAGAAAAEPQLAVEDQAAADRRCPRRRRAASCRACPAPSTNSALVATSTSLPSATLRAEQRFELRGEREAAYQPGRLRAR